MPTWPVTLPQKFLIDGYTSKKRPNVVRTTMEIGPDKTRRRGTASIREHSGPMHFTNAQLATFEEFFEDTIEDGALEFDFPGIRDSTPISVRIIEYDISGVSDEISRISLKLEELP